MPPSPRAYHVATFDPIKKEMIISGGTPQVILFPTTQTGLRTSGFFKSCGLNDVWSLNLNTLQWNLLKGHFGNCENSSHSLFPLFSLFFSLILIFFIV